MLPDRTRKGEALIVSPFQSLIPAISLLTYQILELFCFCFHIFFKLMLLGNMGGFGSDTLMAGLPFHVMGFKRLSRGLLESLCLAADLLFQRR